MKLLIDIPEEMCEKIKDGYVPLGISKYLKKGIPLDNLRAEIIEEKECAYADFERYKIEYLGVDEETVMDELPNDDFRYGMERCIEIIDKYGNKGDDEYCTT